MPGGSYVHVPRPWKATFDVSSPLPARFYVTIISEALRYGMPSRRRGGRALSLVARRGALPKSLIARSLLSLRTTEEPEIDRLVGIVRRRWSTLTALTDRLPVSPPQLHALALHRSIGLTVFLFGAGDAPLLVLKVPTVQDERMDVETRALKEAEPASVAPRSLGSVDEAYLQEGIEGSPLEVQPLGPEDASALRWTERHHELSLALARLGERTAKRGSAVELGDDRIDALRDDLCLSQATRRIASAAWHEARRLNVAVLRHVDTSAQNCLFSRSGAFAALVDWESARSFGAPTWDVWNSAISYLEHSVGLKRWSGERVAETFRASYEGSQFWIGARSAASAAAEAALVPAELVEPLEVAFHASRLGRLLADPQAFATGVPAARRMLEIVCAR